MRCRTKYIEIESFIDEDIFELPRVLEIETIVDKFIGPILKRVPVSIVAVDRCNVGLLNLKASLEIHLVALDQARLRVLDGPGHAGNDCGAHLKGGSALVRSSLSGFVHLKLRTIPVSILRVSIKKNTELIDAFNDFLLNDFPFICDLSASNTFQ